VAARAALAKPKQLLGSSSDAVGSAPQQERHFQFGQPASIPLNWRFFVSDAPGRESSKAGGSKALFSSWPTHSQPQAPAHQNTQALHSSRGRR